MKKFLQNIVRLKTISTIKDFRFGFGFGLHFLPTTHHEIQRNETKYNETKRKMKKRNEMKLADV
jgi:hypothetical protein